jgi:SAM-dependent methyltransferase
MNTEVNAISELINKAASSIQMNRAVSSDHLKRVNLGCGFRKVAGYINIDISDTHDPDVILDVTKGLYFKDNEIDEVRAYDFMEHIPQDKVIFVMSEIHRVLKPGGIFDFFIPSTEGLGGHMDPSHLSYWNINTFLYFVHPVWHDLYPDWPFFKVVDVIRKVCTMPELNIIHITGKVTPIKEGVFYGNS